MITLKSHRNAQIGNIIRMCGPGGLLFCFIGVIQGYICGFTGDYKAVKWTGRIVLGAAAAAAMFAAIYAAAPMFSRIINNTDTGVSVAQAAEEVLPDMELTLKDTDWCRMNRICVSTEVTGADSLAYRYICEKAGEDSGWISKSCMDIHENGEWKIQVRDAAGNITEKAINVDNIDTQAPVILRITEKSEGETISNEE